MRRIIFFLAALNWAAMAAGQTGAVSGCVRYVNSDTTVLRHAAVILSDSLGAPLDTAFSDAAGNYAFNGLVQGTYHLSARPFHPAAGVNAADALLVLQHFVGLITLPGLNAEAADVNMSGSVNASDAFLIQKRFAGLINSFLLNDWISEHKSIALPNQNATLSLHVICAGDVNGSYVPDNTVLLFCGDTLTDIRDGQKYPTVQIGNQCWMKKNLNVGTLLTSGLQYPTNNDTIEKMCILGSYLFCDIYGGLYPWNEMMNYDTTTGIQGICPEGFHIPTLNQWNELINLLGGLNIAGGKLKESGAIHWFAPNTGASNESQFTALGAGTIPMSYFKELLFIWSSTQYYMEDAYFLLLEYNQASTQILHFNKNSLAASVRCLKNGN